MLLRQIVEPQMECGRFIILRRRRRRVRRRAAPLGLLDPIRFGEERPELVRKIRIVPASLQNWMTVHGGIRHQ